MQRFSEIYSLGKTQAELNFVDITPGYDTPLYLDPYALTTREDNWSVDAHGYVVSFFQSVLDAVAKKDREKSVRLLSRLGEPEETHLGVSEKGNKGRGVGGVQANDLYDAILKSKAASSGLLEDLSDFALFIPGIGRDKISDITTNILRKLLITYTQEQCDLHNIPTQSVSSGFCWDPGKEDWNQNYVDLPVYDYQKIILVPKHAVRYQVGVDHSRFRKMFVLDFLQEEHRKADDSLVTTLRDKKGNIRKKIVYKKTVDAHYPTDKDFLTEFSAEHPEVLDKYRDTLKSTASKIPNINGENFHEAVLAEALAADLIKIPKGNKDANNYHELCISILSFLFFPNLLNPKKEFEINDGRKRIDITYTNGKDSGLFYRISLDPNILANIVHVECKNYTNEIANPEIDQLLGRFNRERGRLGLLMFRESNNLSKLKMKCCDVAKQGNGIILPIDDNFLLKGLELVKSGERRLLDKELDDLYNKIVS